jgi:putative addiction module killer protein
MSDDSQSTITVLEYRAEDGRRPFHEWLLSLRDRQARARIRVRIDRVSLGKLGDWRSVGGGVRELRIDYGPGYRVYFGQQGKALVILLCGGDKRSQERDIESAQMYWRDYRRRTR